MFEIKWDANRDPDQKFLVNFKTNTSDIEDGEQFLGQLLIEYPGRIVNTDLELKYTGTVSAIGNNLIKIYVLFKHLKYDVNILLSNLQIISLKITKICKKKKTYEEINMCLNIRFFRTKKRMKKSNFFKMKK